MEREMNERLEALELEVKALRAEVAEIRKVPVASQAAALIKHKEPEKPLTKYIFPEKVQGQLGANTDQKESVAPAKIEPKKPKKTLEESFMWALPKIFMVILVLGVLWGLKLVSDYGFLSDTWKIVGGYLLSTALLGAAIVMEKKKIGAAALITPLYGGAFIVGILTTAAGAIIYDVLGLYVALVIALIYIAYGIGISYVKGNEGLTVFVAFTSLLLPYLLEYMEFSTIIISVFVVLLMGALLLVLVKYKQAIALYVTTFFSILALSILVGNTIEHENFLLLTLVVITGIFYFGWWKIFSDNEKDFKMHIGLLFGVSVFTLGSIAVNSGIFYKPFIVGTSLLAVQLVFVGVLWKEKKRDVFDVMATVAMLTLLNIFISINTSLDTILLLILLTTFAGVMVSIKLRTSIMKVTYSFLFLLATLMVYTFGSARPFFGIENLGLLLVIVFLLTAYAYAKRPKENLTWLEKQLKEIHFLEIIPAIIFGYVLWYVDKFEWAYPFFADVEYGYSYGFLLDITIAILFAGILIIPIRYIGRILPIIAGLTFTLNTLFILMDPLSGNGELAWGIIIRVLYLAVVLAIVVDVWFKGSIYRNFEKYIEEYSEALVITSIIWSVLSIFEFTNFMHLLEGLSWSGAVIINTFSIFIAAVVALLLGKQRDYKKLKLLGLLLLIFGFVKMIFVDLSSLDLLVRSVLFMVIGGVGLLISNRLLKK